MTKRTLPILLAALALTPLGLSANPPETTAPAAVRYEWKSVRMGGCGYVTGIVFHPAEKGLAYCRTDMGGAYRRDTPDGEWTPILDWIPAKDVNLMGVESIAVDPEDPDMVYLACGTSSGPEAPDGAILISKDRGRTFETVRVPFQFGANENGRGNGERMAVDPKNGKIIYLGTRYDGLVRSIDGGHTWARVVSFPDATDITAPSGMSVMEQDFWLHWKAGGAGVIRVIFPPDAEENDASGTIYVAVSLAGENSLFETHDSGETWTPLPGQPTNLRPTDMDLSPDGCLYVSYGTAPGPFGMTDGAVWKYDTAGGKWTNVTPARSGAVKAVEHSEFGYCSVAVDPEKPGVVMAVPLWYVGGEDIFRSLDGGKTWKPILREAAKWDYSKIPYSKVPILHWMTDVEVDPFDSDHLMFVTGFGGMETYDLGKSDAAKSPAEGSTWMPMMTGIEESVPLDFFAPKEGPTLVTAVGDYGGFIHYDLDKSPAEGNFANPRFDNSTGLGVAWRKENIYVRVGTAWKGAAANIALSCDSGKTWVSGTNIAPDAKNGSVAISADGSTIVWTPDDVRKPGDWLKIDKTFAPHFSADGGKTWAKCAGLPDGIRVEADTVNPLKFYAFDAFTRMFYTSGDGAHSFTGKRIALTGAIPVRNRMRGDARSGRDHVVAVPDREGDLWICLYDGLYHLQKDGSFLRMPHMEKGLALGFGKAAPGTDYPALYLIGTADGQPGVFRSDDAGLSYVRINDDAHQWGSLLLVTGDMKRYGRVYLAAHGRGALYGDIASENGTKPASK